MVKDYEKIYSDYEYGETGLYYEDDKLIAPECTVPNPASAYATYEAMRKSHVRRVFNYSRIQGLIDGNAPFSKIALRQKGLETQSNVNWRDAESFFESTCLTYWSLFNDVKNVATFTTSISSPESNALIAEIVSDTFDEVIRSWEDFQSVMSEHQSDLVKFGLNIIHWNDERDWRYDSGDVFRVLFPEKSRNKLDSISVVAIEHAMSAQDLFNIYEYGDDKYWNKEALAEFLLANNMHADDKLYSNQYIKELQQKIRSGDLSLDELYNDDLMLVTMLFREWDNTITRIIMPVENYGSGMQYLYKADKQYDSLGEAIQIFTLTPGGRYIHETKGLGHKMYNVMEGISQIDNSLMDGVRRAQTVLVNTQAGRNKDPKKIKFIHGGIVDIGEAKIAQNLMGANLASSVEVANYFRQKLEYNHNISGTNMQTRDPKPKTFSEMTAQATKEAKIQKNRIAHYYSQLDKLLREVVCKMLKSKEGYPGYEFVKVWKDKCIAKGVPPEFFELTKANIGLNGLPEHMTVRATRASGSGSQFADQIEIKACMSLLPTLGQRGKLNVMRDYISAFRGFEYVERYMPLEDQTQQPTSEDTLASIENNQLEKGEMVIVSPDNVHAVHAQRHINRLKQLAEEFLSAADTARQNVSDTPFLDAEKYGAYSLFELDTAFQTLGPHLTRHIIFLQRDPTQEALVKSLVQEWNVLANFGDKIAKNAQDSRMSQMKQAKKEQMMINEKIPSEERIAMAEIDSKERVSIYKINKDIRRNANRDQLRFLLDRQKASMSGDVERAKAISQICSGDKYHQ